MKSGDLNKKSISIESIRKEIKTNNEQGMFKYFIPHWIYISDSVKLQLMRDGFKVYEGCWDGVINNALIIEW